jgi:hypothetical protein
MSNTFVNKHGRTITKDRFFAYPTADSSKWVNCHSEKAIAAYKRDLVKEGYSEITIEENGTKRTEQL